MLFSLQEDFLKLVDLFLSDKKAEALALLEKIVMELKIIGKDELHEKLKMIVMSHLKLDFNIIKENKE